MGEALAVMVPLMLFMLIPVWIPVMAVAFGAVADRLASRKERRAHSPVRMRSNPVRSAAYDQ